MDNSQNLLCKGCQRQEAFGNRILFQREFSQLNLLTGLCSVHQNFPFSGASSPSFPLSPPSSSQVLNSAQTLASGNSEPRRGTSVPSHCLTSNVPTCSPCAPSLSTRLPSSPAPQRPTGDRGPSPRVLRDLAAVPWAALPLPQFVLGTKLPQLKPKCLGCPLPPRPGKCTPILQCQPSGLRLPSGHGASSLTPLTLPPHPQPWPQAQPTEAMFSTWDGPSGQSWSRIVVHTGSILGGVLQGKKEELSQSDLPVHAFIRSLSRI